MLLPVLILWLGTGRILGFALLVGYTLARSQILVSLSGPINGLLDQVRWEEVGTPYGSVDEPGGLMADLSMQEDVFPAFTTGQCKGQESLRERSHHRFGQDLE